MIKSLEWDSAFFGFPVGIIKLTSEPNWEKFILDFHSQAANYSLIYFITSQKLLIPPGILKDFNGYFINQRVLYQKRIGKPGTIFPTYIKEYRSSILTPGLLQLALISGSFSRFRIDQNMPVGKFEELYKLWIKGSLEKILADRIYIATRQNNIKAMVTCTSSDGICNIGLVAVHDSEKGKGTGRYLIQKVEEQANNDGLDKVRVPTQSNNVSACYFYENLGFSPFEVSNYYHFWIR